MARPNDSDRPPEPAPVVWVVDDSPLEARAVLLALSPSCRVSVFTDGAMLLEALGHQPPPDVLVMDWEMPGLTGIEVCHYLRGSPATQALPVLLLTGHQDPEDVAEGLAAGANDYAFKPFRAGELTVRVHALVRWSRLHGQATAAHAHTRQHLTDETARRLRVEDTLAEVQAAEARALRSEQRFRLAARATRDAIWEWEPRTDTMEWSGAHPLLGELEPGRTVTSAWWEERIHPEERARVMEGFRAAVEGPAEHWQDAYRFRRADGAWADVVDRALILREGGRAVQVVGALQDVTAQRRLEAEARQRADFERQLIGIVSHDLRNPLSASHLAARALVRRGTLDEAQERGLQRILVSTERAIRLIKDLLDFTRAREGSLPLHRRATDLHETVRGVTEEVQSAHPDRCIELEQSGSGEGRWDPDRLAQVLTNLLGNALAYSPRDTPVWVRARGTPDTVVLEVHNTGTPIDPERLPRIFEPLERGTTEQSHPAGSSIGLGLYIVRGIVQSHGGSVRVHSTAAEGTTFTVVLPREPLL